LAAASCFFWGIIHVVFLYIYLFCFGYHLMMMKSSEKVENDDYYLFDKGGGGGCQVS